VGLTIGIDASRSRSGGARAHLVGILSATNPPDHGIDRVHVWAFDALLDDLPNASWLTKHRPEAIQGSLVRQMWWQRRALPIEARRLGCDIMLNTDAGTVCPFSPAVVISQDMLSYEPGEMRRYWFSRMWLRLFALRYVQALSMRRADGVIFLTEYASRAIQKVIGRLSSVAVIPHGVGAAFRRASESGRRRQPDTNNRLRCLYVSQADFYKHQWNVVRAIADLRTRGHEVSLVLAGGGSGRPQALLDQELAASDPDRAFVTLAGFVAPSALVSMLDEADIFIFASSCESMPNTLIEGMASGLPIACSDRGPMPEVLVDGGVYFDPELAASISSAVGQLVTDASLRDRLGRRAAALSSAYSWQRCGADTWKFLRQVAVDAGAVLDSRENSGSGAAA
jgi:glycosyltransferase involved in cell wall biosynthesis